MSTKKTLLSLSDALCLEELVDKNTMLRRSANELITAGRQSSSSTQKTYHSAWRGFREWCEKAGVSALPASEDSLCCYLADLATRKKYSTLCVYTWAVVHEHRLAGKPSPCGARTMMLLGGVTRKYGQQISRKAALTVTELRDINKRLNRDQWRGARNAAVLLLGFATGLRRCDLCALNVEDIEIFDRGLIVHVGVRKREKTDQAGKGRSIAVFRGATPDTCPMVAVTEWLQFRGGDPTKGPLFLRRNDQISRMEARTIARIVQMGTKAIGLDPTRYGGHSLRAGMITACSAAGVPDSAIMQRSGHTSVATLNMYVRNHNLFATANPLDRLL